MKFVIKLFPEIIIKSRPVRKRLIKQLRQNIRRVMKPLDEAVRIRGSWDRIEVAPSRQDDDLLRAYVDKFRCIPGIDYILVVDEHRFDDLEHLQQLVCRIYSAAIKDKTFCVRVKRTGSHDFTSVEAERQIGSALYRVGEPLGVKLKDPDVEVQLEILKNRLFTVSERIRGLGGYPMGFQDAALSLISGGYDSGVSTYLLNKRGVRTHYCFFNLGGTAHEVGVKQVAHFIWEKYSSSHRVRFVSVPFEPVVEEILTKVHHSYMGVILKRLMLRAATKLAEDHGIPAIVTGESIAQVSSQTMINLNVIDQVSNHLVFRPLVTMNKQEIIAIARDIGTETYAKTMPEYCGVISDRPTTAAKLERVLEEESRFDFSVLDKAIENAQVSNIDEVLSSEKSVIDIDVVTTPQFSDIVIDIRHPSEQESSPLNLTSNQVMAIPFYQLERKFSELPGDSHYLLYCGKGVMSQMQAQRLQEQGYKNVKVFKQ